MTIYQLTCPHSAVPLVLPAGGSLRARHAAERDARHRLSALTGCRCGWEAISIQPGAPGPRSVALRRIAGQTGEPWAAAVARQALAEEAR